jgi:hypothetical protein
MCESNTKLEFILIPSLRQIAFAYIESGGLWHRKCCQPSTRIKERFQWTASITQEESSHQRCLAGADGSALLLPNMLVS